MAVALDTLLGIGNSSGSATTTITTGAAVAAGSMVIVRVARWAIDGTSTLAFAGGSLTWAKDHEVTSGNVKIAQFRAHAPSGLASSTVLTATHGNVSSGLDCLADAVAYSGIDTSGTVTAFNGAGAATSAWGSGSVTGNVGDALIGGCFRDGGSATSSAPGGSATERYDTNNAGQNETLVTQDLLSIAGSTALTGTWSAAAGHVAVAVSYKAAAGGTGPAVKQLATMGVG